MSYTFDDLILQDDANGDIAPSGHVTHRATVHSTAKKVIYKENKLGRAINSSFEVAFSRLANSFLAPGVTAPQHLVLDRNAAICGVASDNIAYTIFNTLQARHHLLAGQVLPFVKFDETALYPFESTPCSDAEAIIKSKVVTFFDEHQPGLLSRLYELKASRQVTFDMDSLASVLTSSYTLEEDDLHKGNFGFYLLQREGHVPEVHFIKIDHDLMMIDSVMSRGNARLANLLYTDYAFDISLRDLLRFPVLMDSGNHYWPARSAFLCDYRHSKAYTSSEISAIAKLSQDKQFIKAKWRALYKHILIPKETIRDAVSAGFDGSPQGKAYIDLVTNAVIARQARLRSALLAIPQFRIFLQEMSRDDRYSLYQEISADDHVQRSLRKTDRTYRRLCQADGAFKEGDTPLHAAIRIGDYRYDESHRHYQPYLKMFNSDKQTALDLAIAQWHLFTNLPLEKQATIKQDVRKNSEYIIYDLIQRGAKAKVYTDDLKEIKRLIKRREWNSFAWDSAYVHQARNMHSREDLLRVFDTMSVDDQLTLKMKKQISVFCLKAYISVNKNADYADQLFKDLAALKLDLKGAKGIAPNPQMQFIRQLRSQLWIVRQIRGLLGGSSTQVEMNDIIAHELHALNQTRHGHRFFQKQANTSLYRNILKGIVKEDVAEKKDDKPNQMNDDISP